MTPPGSQSPKRTRRLILYIASRARCSSYRYPDALAATMHVAVCYLVSAWPGMSEVRGHGVRAQKRGVGLSYEPVSVFSRRRRESSEPRATPGYNVQTILSGLKGRLKGWDKAA